MNSSDDCSRKLKVLSEATRLRILRLLLSGSKGVSEIQQSLKVEPTLLSHHLKTLKDAHLVIAIRDGKNVLYQLDPQARGMESDVGNEHQIDLGCCKISFSDSSLGGF